jgi:hypothetical protein
MKALFIVLQLAGCGCATQPQLPQVVRIESARLQEVHERWLAERPRKFDFMEMPASGLSATARKLGFHAATVSTGVVVFWTSEAEGLVFAQSDIRKASEDLGFRAEATDAPDIWKVKAIRRPVSTQR